MPKSDVSGWVGAVGLLTLVGYILFARNFPAVVEAFGFDGSRGRLSGPYSALLAMALTGVAMAAWSVLVDKVHRRPTTGIDWSRRKPVTETLDVSITKLAGLWVTWFAIGAFYCLGRWYWDGQYLFAMEVLGAAVVPLLVLSVPYVVWLDRVLVNPRDHAWHFGAMLIGRESYDGEQVRKHARTWFIKGFFGAFMISILPPGFASVVETDFAAIAADPVRLGTALFELLFVIDVQIGTVGYLLTMRPLDAQIRSGNPFLAGWLAALACYPPFSWGVLGNILAYETNTAGWAYWLGDWQALLWVWLTWLVFLTAVYAWATMAFGIRFSNLTYRGVLTNGPYRFTRHPAYLSKNLFWWSTVMPFLVTGGSLTDMVRNTVFLAVVSGIYYWRARTEEAHLLLEDERYGAYHAWMQEHGAVTSRLARVLVRIDPRRPVRLQPAE
ncbi:protein-S-isoprenylcysteine methyltransferase [Aurantiacibacter luteus]|uniref:Protein-S-isoprenylcysteine methyltransferase n=1 Tax=Aurantiacibacter luteus TaxID=1581420 RepID=A0A0G9MWQ4_9SPHN|nr:protein-S-isoprenylcysteine methyltransferase [Aurantiacibacter luteus]